MTMTKTKYSVGDKVRILDVDGILFGYDYWKNGDIAKVTGVKTNGSIYVFTTESRRGYFLISHSELAYIEKVDAKPTKKQRISALEAQVADLQAQVARLQGVERALKNVELQVSATTDVGKIAEQLAEMVAGKSVIPRKKAELTPNELRKAIIAEARAFVAELTAYINPENGGYKREHPKYGTIEGPVDMWKARSFFEVKSDKHEVTVVLKPKLIDNVIAKGIAKCAPGDVFNADIGKAIALGRALGLDVSKFEQAVQPTVPRKGMVVRLASGKLYTLLYDHNKLPIGERITDDTEAQYV